MPYSEFERDAADGTLPDFSLIEPNMLSGHSDYHPAFGRSLIARRHEHPDGPPVIDPAAARRSWPASTTTIRSAASPDGSNAYNTLFFIGWDEPGGTYDHVPPGPVPPPDPSAPAGQLDFKFDRSGYRVPAIIVSPWVDEGIVINDEHRHTSMIATLRKVWGLGDAFTGRDAAAATFDHLLSRETPRDPASWPDVEALPVPQFHMDMVQMGKALSVLGKTAGSGMLEHAKQSGLVIPRRADRPQLVPRADRRGLAKHRAAGLPAPSLSHIEREAILAQRASALVRLGTRTRDQRTASPRSGRRPAISSLSTNPRSSPTIRSPRPATSSVTARTTNKPRRHSALATATRERSGTQPATTPQACACARTNASHDPSMAAHLLIAATSAHASRRSGPVRPVLGSANSRSGSCKQVSSHGGVDTSIAA